MYSLKQINLKCLETLLEIIGVVFNMLAFKYGENLLKDYENSAGSEK